MPIFEYQCQKCEHTFEELVLGDKQPELKCPSCNSRKVKKLLSAGNIRPVFDGAIFFGDAPPMPEPPEPPAE